MSPVHIHPVHLDNRLQHAAGSRSSDLSNGPFILPATSAMQHAAEIHAPGDPPNGSFTCPLEHQDMPPAHAARPTTQFILSTWTSAMQLVPYAYACIMQPVQWINSSCPPGHSPPAQFIPGNMTPGEKAQNSEESGEREKVPKYKGENQKGHTQQNDDEPQPRNVPEVEFSSAARTAARASVHRKRTLALLADHRPGHDARLTENHILGRDVPVRPGKSCTQIRMKLVRSHADPVAVNCRGRACRTGPRPFTPPAGD